MAAIRIFTLARRVIAQLRADRRTLALILGVPLIVLSVAGVLVRLESSAAHIAVVLEDTGAQVPIGGGRTINLGERLVESLGSVAEQLTVEALPLDEAQRRLEDGEIDAIITLPADFSQRAIEDRAVTIPVVYEGSNPTVARMLGTMLTRGAVQMLAGLSVVSTGSAPQITIDATYRYGSAEFDQLDYLAPVFIGLFVFMFVFILTSVAFLRERVAGTLERLQATSIRQHEIILGYMLGFALFAIIQSLVVLLFTIYGLKVHTMGSLINVFAVEVLLALLAVNLGIFLSTFARNEFQIVQFIPLVVVLPVFLSGALWPIEAMPGWLQPLAYAIPLTYANHALRDVMIKGFNLIEIGPYLLALAAFAAFFVVLSSLVLRRQVGT
jgi:ABC-2 type transport system permease protein